MGKAVILQNIGEGLYKARPLFDFAVLDAEVTRLEAEQSRYYRTLLDAFKTRDALLDERSVAASAMDAVIEQWRAGLISDAQPSPPPTAPDPQNDPETGQPWDDPDRAQEGPLLTLINQYRAANGKSSLSRDNKLNAAALNYLRTQRNSQRMGHIGVKGDQVGDRARWATYSFETIGELLAYGWITPAQVIAQWQQDTGQRAYLLGDYAACGLAYTYATQHAATHLWCVVLATPSNNPLPGVFEDPPKDPATEAAQETEAELERIEVPRISNAQPKKMGDAVQRYAMAAQKLAAAERELTRIQAEKMERDRRLAELKKIKQQAEQVSLDVWCCTYSDQLMPGQQVETFEVPGFWQEKGVTRTTTLKKNTPQAYTVSYVERSWNIAPSGTGYPPHGQLTPSMSLSSALLFYNIAFEPASLKWRPVCRYGAITAIDPASSNLCTVELLPVNARPMRGERQSLSLIEAGKERLQNVPIYYTPCYQWAFSVGDTVLVTFQNFDRTQPQVIGFRREPVNCQGRTGWTQVGF